MVGVLLAIGIAALLAVYPLGGWATGVIGALKPADFAPWLVLLVPVVLIIAERIPGGNLGAGTPVFEHLLLVVGLGSAVWGGLWAIRGRRSMRYGRVFMADIALCVAAVEGAPASPALTGALIILITHLTLAPILLRSENAGLALAPPGGLGAAQWRAAVADVLGSPAHPGGARRGERRLDHRSRDRDGGHLHRRGHGVLDESSDRSGARLRRPASPSLRPGCSSPSASQSAWRRSHSPASCSGTEAMDPLGLLLEVVALAVYPGGLFLAALAWITCAAPGLTRGIHRSTFAGLAAIAAAVVAAAMAPLPGTPASSLPPDGGATPNLIAAVLLVVVAGALVAPEPWSRRRRVLVTFGGISIVLLGLGATSFSSTDIAAAAGGVADAARILDRWSRCSWHCRSWSNPSAPVCPLWLGRRWSRLRSRSCSPSRSRLGSSGRWRRSGSSASSRPAAVYALLLRLGRAMTQGESAPVVAVAWLCSVAASVVAVVAARP